MSQEIEVQWLPGKTLYFLLRNSVGQVYNGATFVAYATADLASYAIAATEQGTASGYYTATFPSVAAGIYNAVAFERAGGSPAEGDLNAGSGDILWDGTAVANLSAFAIALLKQSFTGLTGEGARSALNALRKLMNKWDTTATPGKLSVYKEDDTVVAYTQDITTDASADPITSLDTN